MPFTNKIGGGSSRKFGLTRRSTFWLCNTHSGIAVLNNADKKCYYPANYAATATTTQQQVQGCHSGGGAWGSDPSTWSSCCSCSGCPYSNCIGCFSLGCQCYAPGWHPLGNTSGGCYAPYYITQNVTSYSCPVNSSAASLSGTTCVYPATYNATMYS
jgi:hypothetical protein